MYSAKSCILSIIVVASCATGCRYGYELIDYESSGGPAGGSATPGEASGGGSGALPGEGGSGNESGAGNSGSGGSGGTASAGGGAGGTTEGGQGGSSSAGGSSGSGGLAAGGLAGSSATGGDASGGDASGGTGGTGGLVDLVVTTASDESDAGATPDSPGQTGFSLREAITFSNSEPGFQAITFEQSDFILALTSPLPAIEETLTINGPLVIDGSGSLDGSACLTIQASDVLVDNLEIHSCPGEPVVFSLANSTGNQVSNCYIHDNSDALVVHGDGTTVFFNYVSFSAGRGIEVFATNASILANEIVGSPNSNLFIHSEADDVFILANLSIGGDSGIAIEGGTGAQIWHNTVVDSVSAAIDLGNATSVDVRNNIFFGAGTFGLLADQNQLTGLDYNLYFDNASGNCSSCTPGTSAVFEDPLFVDPSTWDYSLSTGSPAIDAGVDLGEDRNLDQDGLYNGTGPDIGFIEAE